MFVEQCAFVDAAVAVAVDAVVRIDVNVIEQRCNPLSI